MSQPLDLARMRHEYDESGDRRPAIREDEVDRGLSEDALAADWTTQFTRWFTDALACGLPEPNAMIVATATPDARPSARTVLLKRYDQRGFVFYTNYSSRKGREALANPAASLVFPWFAMSRQVVVCGRITPVDRAETEEYFHQRPRDAQLGAWASEQSSVLPDRAALDQAYAQVKQRYGGGSGGAERDAELGAEPGLQLIPPPPDWGGLRVEPETVEFWQGRRSRLHDRLRYRQTEQGWIVERLAP